MRLFRVPYTLAIPIILLTHSALVQAEYLNNIDVIHSNDSTDVVVHFDKNFLFERYFPQNEAKVLFIHIRLIDTQSRTEDRSFVEETLWTKKSDGIPKITASYTNNNNQLVVTFSQPVKYTVRPGEDSRSIVISLAPSKNRISKPIITQPGVPPPVVTPSPPAVPTAEMSGLKPAEALPGPTPSDLTDAAVPPARSPAEIERLAKALMEDAQRALAGKQAEAAVTPLNRILGFPANSQTQAAQALVGEARELNGDIAKARAEYESYLKLYPNGVEATRIREHLAALPKSQVRAPRALPTEAGPAAWTFFSNVSVNYYGGNSLIDTTAVQGTNTVNQSRLALVDQKSLITSINLNARRRDGFTDTRIAVRDTNNRDSLNSSRSYNRLYSAYIDHNDRKLGYYVRFGRQNPNGIGVFERFDGAQAGYNLNPEWRLNGVYGEAVEFNSPYKKVFYGSSVDFLPQQNGVPGVSLYALNQTLDGFENRRALGTEVRYFDGHTNAYGTLDYDVLYRGLNVALLQGNYLSDAGTNYFAVFDRRRTPSYSLTNALLAAPGLTIQQIIAAQGIAATRDQAKALAAISSSLSFGLTHPLNQDWQVGADYRASEISSTRPITAVVPISIIGTCVGTIDPTNIDNCIFDTASQEASGRSHSVSFQVTGNNLFTTNAVGLSSASFIKAPSFFGQSYSLGYVLPVGQQWRFDANVRYYTQKDNDGNGNLNRISPNFKIFYQWRDSIFLEGEIGREISNTTTPTQTDRTRRDYFSTGLRWETR